MLLVGACSLGNTEEDSLHLVFDPLYYSSVEPFTSGERALQGSNACFDIFRVRTADDWIGADPPCHDITLAGAPIEEGHCDNLEELGELLLEFTPRDDCPHPELEGQLVPDRFRMQVIPIDGLRAQLEWVPELSALRWLDPGPRGSFPDDLVPLPPEPVRLVPNVVVPFPIDVIDATGDLVAWSPERGRVYETSAGGPRQELLFEEGTWPIRTAPGERTTITLELDGTELPVAEVIATPVDEAASIEIVVGYNAPPQDDPERAMPPYAARAMVRDAEGRVIYGSPVRWTLLEGHLALDSSNDIANGLLEYTGLSDACDPPPSAPTERRAIVRAELEGLSDEVELEWTAMPVLDDEFEPDPACQRVGSPLEERGCGCALPRERMPGPYWLVVLATAFLRRRGPRARSSG